MRSILVILSLLALGGCMGSTRGTSATPATPTGARAGAIDRSDIARARTRVDSAARTGDAAALAMLFARDALVQTAAGDTLRGGGRAGAYLASMLPSGGAELRLYPQRTEWCLDGAYEFGGEYVVREQGGAHRELARGGYALRWARGTGGDLVVHTLVLHDATSSASARARSVVRCIAPHTVAFEERRVELALTPPHAGLWTWNAGESLVDRLRAQGYGRYILRVPGGATSSEPGPKLRDEQAIGAITARWRVRPPVSLQAIAAFTPATADLLAYDADRSANLSITYEGLFAGALVSYEWRRLRAGVGPAVIFSDWALEEERLVQIEDAEGMPIGWTSEGVVAREAWSSTTPALLGEIAYTYPITRRVFADFIAQGRFAAVSDTRALPSLPPVSVDLGGYTLALALGFAF